MSKYQTLIDAPESGSALPDVEAAAKVLAAKMDYPWEYMPEQGRKSMRENAKAVIDAAKTPAVRALLADLESAEKDAGRYRFLAAHCRSTSEHWGGRWSIVVEGPAPKTHDSEDDFDAAIDAALAQMAGG